MLSINIFQKLLPETSFPTFYGIFLEFAILNAGS